MVDAVDPDRTWHDAVRFEAESTVEATCSLVSERDVEFEMVDLLLGVRDDMSQESLRNLDAPLFFAHVHAPDHCDVPTFPLGVPGVRRNAGDFAPDQGGEDRAVIEASSDGFQWFNELLVMGRGESSWMQLECLQENRLVRGRIDPCEFPDLDVGGHAHAGLLC